MDRFTIRDGEDVAPEFCLAEELGDFEAGATVTIDIAPPEAKEQIAATVESVAITSGFVHVRTKEFAYPFLIPVGTTVRFADDEPEMFEGRCWYDDKEGWMVDVVGTADRKKVFHGPDAQEKVRFPGPSAGHRLIDLGYTPDRRAMYEGLPGMTQSEVRTAGMYAGWRKVGTNMWVISCYRRQ